MKVLTMGDYIKMSPEKALIKLDDENWGRMLGNFLKDFKGRLAIVASGSSHNVAKCIKDVYEKHLSISVELIYSNTFVNYASVNADKYIVISQSGNSKNSLKALEKLKANKADVIFITDNEDYKSNKDYAVEYLDVHDEKVPFVTIGFTTTLLLLYKALYLACDLDLKPLFKAIEVAKDLINKGEGYADMHPELATMDRLSVAGSGNLYGIASEVALKFKETMQVSACHYEIEEFLHGGNFSLKENDFVFLITDSLASTRANEIDEHLNILTNKSYLFDFSTYIEDELLALAIIPFFQIIVYKMNDTLGNHIPLMGERYLAFEGALKSKTKNYY